MIPALRLPAAALCLALAAPVAAEDPAPALSSYDIDSSAISVSGISSGAYMAVQYHVAHSSRVMGAGVVAGGPFYCAQDSAVTALTTCMDGTPRPSPDTLQEVTNALAGGGDVDATANLAGDRVYLFSGTRDTVVATPVMQALETYYRGYIAADDIVFVDTVDAPHSFVTDYSSPQAGGTPSLSASPQVCAPSCPDMMSCFNLCIGRQQDCPANPCLADNHCTYVNDCGYDTAHHILTHIYGSLEPAGDPSDGSVVAFDQSEFAGGDPNAIGMADTGYLYVPSACDGGDAAACRLHVAFHGCLQGADRIGDAFYSGAGYNRWAESNNVIVLYPQAIGSSVPQLYNPMGCWDWWGFTGPFYPRKEGRQVRAVDAMVDRLTGAAAASD
jgi:poly(3-hydroxybutyrate) depolymerase